METCLFEHILYEMRTYIVTWKLLHSPQGYPGQIVHNPLYESHVLHLRNLIDFFNCDDKGHVDDIFVNKVLIDSSNYYIETSTDLRKAINKTVQHLSTYRAKQLDKHELSNAINDLYPIVLEKINKFYNDIQNHNNLCTTYKDDYEKYLLQKDPIDLSIYLR